MDDKAAYYFIPTRGHSGQVIKTAKRSVVSRSWAMKGWDTQGCQDREMTLWKHTLCLMRTAWRKPRAVGEKDMPMQGHRVQERVSFKIEMIYINYFPCLSLCGGVPVEVSGQL